MVAHRGAQRHDAADALAEVDEIEIRYGDR